MPIASGPDFLCIGMHKAGTQWLYDQTQAHPDFWMPPIKELHYFERGENGGDMALDIVQGERRTYRSPRLKWRDITDPRDRAFISEMAAECGRPVDLDAYGALFRHKGGLISGDITPQYGSIEEGLVEGIARRFPETTIILLVRDPVARAWSHISQWDRREKFNVNRLRSREKFRAFLDRSKKLDRFSSAARTAECWTRHVRKDKFHFFFFDDIALQPDVVRGDILRLLGADPAKSSGELDPGHNRKAGNRKLEFTREVELELAGRFKEELAACARIFGGHAKTWAAKYEALEAA
jgi:hypothetical protein